MPTRITRNYHNFAGVDYTGREIEINRSPDSLNMWKDYGNSDGRFIQTRPGITEVVSFGSYASRIYGIFFYELNGTVNKIIHSGTNLYLNGSATPMALPATVSALNPANSQAFVYNGTWFFKDGLHYLEYDGSSLVDVRYSPSVYVPTTTIAKAPAGGGTVNEDVNMLTGMRKNTFVADGVSTDYFVDATGIDSNYATFAFVNDELMTVANGKIASIDHTAGKIVFTSAPPLPDTTGQANVIIQFRKTNTAYEDRILHCSILEVFDNRIFFSGYANLPNTVFHSSLNNPRYCSDLDYYNEGLDRTPIRSMVAGNNAIWVIKKPAQANTAVYYHTPVVDATYGKIYPSTHSSISTGCIGSAINFNDDIVYFSDRGMEGCSTNITTEQAITHRSTLVDNKLLNEADYKNMLLVEHEGYLLVCMGKNIYVADSRQTYNNHGHKEYEWYYWEFENEITAVNSRDGVLYLAQNDGLTHSVFSMNAEATDIDSYWSTPFDEFGYGNMQKTTNKRGGVADVIGESVSVSVQKDNEDETEAVLYENTKGYITYRIREKKFKSMKIKFSSTKPFGLISAMIEVFIGSYVKR